MVEINIKTKKVNGNEEEIINKVVEAVLASEKIKHDLDVYITLTTNGGIHKINKQYREVDRPTDVLSFPMFQREEIPNLRKKKKDTVEEILGDIIVSIDKVKEQSKEYGHSYERELAYLVTHGMLHLLGYDHMIEKEKEEMRKHEEKVLKALGYVR